MIFNNMDEYEIYVREIDEQKWENLTMDADKIEHFHEAMNQLNEDMVQADRGGVYLPTDPGAKAYEYVDKPKHYDWFDIQAIDAIAKVLTHEQLKGFLMGTAMRYRLRMGTKPNEPVERDIRKAQWYEEYWHKYVADNTP